MPDSRLPHARKPHHGDHTRDESLSRFLADDLPDVTQDIGDILRRADELENEPNSRDKDKHKEALAHIIDQIVAYHILPESYEAADLIQNSTYATNLTLADGSTDYKPLRMSVPSTSIPPHFNLRINMFVEGDEARYYSQKRRWTSTISALFIKSADFCSQLPRYSKRPSLRQMFFLSSQVASNASISSGLLTGGDTQGVMGKKSASRGQQQRLPSLPRPEHPSAFQRS
ncbi:hypothetical protein JVU11DRAFT_396 [Chiua virens]|nr:hypothetical protein JVU11DRAFT_396 [Chiua virens]